MSISVFLSTVSDEFRAYRDLLRGDLTRHNVAVKVQEDFKDLGGLTLDKLDVYIAHCDAVVHLIGDMTGSAPDARELDQLKGKHSDLAERLPPLGEALKNSLAICYTQWEAWLALYHKRPLMIATAAQAAPRGPNYAPNDDSRAAQAAHLARLKTFDRYPGCEFQNPDDLAKHIAYSAILDLLVEDYAKQAARQRDVAEGFIEEMAKRVAGDKALDFDGMKQAVLNAIEIYETEIAGRPVETNLDDLVGRALTRAKEQVDKGQSRLARATLRSAAEAMRRDDEERRERYVAGATRLYNRERDIALASYDGEAAAEAILALADAVHGANAAAVATFLKFEAESLEEYGRDRGSNVHLVAAIAVRRELLALTASDGERGAARTNLGIALRTLGERESGTARLEQAVEVYRVALQERTRERVPLGWAMTQNNLGNALRTLGERESGTARLEEAIEAFHAALEEWTRERVPLRWAGTQMNLGVALQRLGERESGTVRLEEAVAAYRAALEEWLRYRVPLDWATAQNNLGNALQTLGGRESGTARLDEAVAAYRAALEECTRERVPLQWASTQMNLGAALQTLGQRESGTVRLEQAVAAFRAALEELTRDRVPLQWASTQNNLGDALRVLGERESGTARLEEAVAAYRAALEERTRERVPLDWAQTQNGLGSALRRLGERKSGTAQLEEAVVAFRAALEEWTCERVPLAWALTQNNLGGALRALGERAGGTVRLAEVAAYRAALEENRRERVPLEWARTQMNLGIALARLGEREGGTARLEQAVEAFRVALEERTRERAPLDWAHTQGCLGNVLRTLGEWASGTARLEEAVAAYRAALEELTRERVPLDWAYSQHGLANALSVLAERQKNAALLEEALACMRGAVDAYRQAGEGYWLPIAQRRIPEIEAELAGLKG